MTGLPCVSVPPAKAVPVLPQTIISIAEKQISLLSTLRHRPRYVSSPYVLPPFVLPGSLFSQSVMSRIRLLSISRFAFPHDRLQALNASVEPFPGTGSKTYTSRRCDKYARFRSGMRLCDRKDLTQSGGGNRRRKASVLELEQQCAALVDSTGGADPCYARH